MAEEIPLFDDGRAERYDRIISRIVVGYEAMHRLARAAVMLEPDVRRVLVVGVGTAEEVVSLARDLPDATFVGVDPSADMLALARAKVAMVGMSDRIDFVLGTVCDAPSGPFDVASELLVAHFMPPGAGRVEHFRQIASRLRPGGVLVESALVDGPYEALWRSVLSLGFDAAKVDDIVQGFCDDIYAIGAEEFLANLKDGGFVEPTELFRSLYVRMWTVRKD